MPCHIPDSRASNLRLQRKSRDLPELVLVRFALRHESTRSRTARLGKGVAKDCSFAISKINAGDRDDKPEQNRVAGKELGSRLNSESLHDQGIWRIGKAKSRRKKPARFGFIPVLPSRSPLPLRLMPVRLGPVHLVIPNSSISAEEV